MPVFAITVFVFTLAMLAVHLATMSLARRMTAPGAPRWLSLANLIRFEGLYYVVLAAFVLAYPDRRLLWPLAAMGTLHLGVWAVAELRPGWLKLAAAGEYTERIMRGIQLFDWIEALVLGWIAWTLIHI